MNFVQKLRDFLLKKRDFSIPVNEKTAPLVKPGVDYLGKLVNTFNDPSLLNKGLAGFRAVADPSGAVRGAIEETRNPKSIMPLPLRPIHGAVKGHLRGIVDPEYSVYNMVKDTMEKKGVSPVIAVPIALGTEILLPGFGGEMKAVGKSTKELGEALKLVDNAKDITKIRNEIGKLNDLIKTTKDFVEKSKLLKQRDELLKIVNPEIKKASEESINFMESIKKANEARASIQKEINPLQEQLSKIKKEASKIYKRTDIDDAEKKRLAAELYKQTNKSEIEKSINELVKKRNSIVNKIDEAADTPVNKFDEIVDTPLDKLDEVEYKPKKSIREMLKTPKEEISSIVDVFAKPKTIGELIDMPKEKITSIVKDKVLFRDRTEAFIKKLQEHGIKEEDFINDYQLGKLSGTEVAKEWKNITNELRKWAMNKTGKDMGYIENYYMRVYLDTDKVVARELGDNIIDDIAERTYSPFATRTRRVDDVAGDYLRDIRAAVDEYVDRVDYEANKAFKDAITKKTSPKAEEILQETAQKVADDIVETGKSNVDILDTFKKAHQENVKVGLVKSTEPIVITKRISGVVGRLLKDKIQILDDLGLYKHLEPFINYQQNAARLVDEIKEAGLMSMEKTNELVGLLAEKLNVPEERLANIIEKINIKLAKKYARAFNELSSSGLTKVEYEKLLNRLVKKQNLDYANDIEKLITKSYKNKGIEVLQDVAGRLKIDDTETRKWLNDNILEVITKDATINNVYYKSLREFNKATTYGFIGGNVRSSLLNVFESRRVFGLVHPRVAFQAIADTFIDFINRKTPYYVKHGYKEIMYVDMPKVAKNKVEESVNRLSKAYNDLGEASLILFKKTENLKNSIFTRAFEYEGMRKGLSGQELNNFIDEMMRKFAIYGDEWGKPGLFNNELAATIFKFSQYPIREMVINYNMLRGLKNVPKGDLRSIQYLASWVVTSIVLMKLYERIGMDENDAFFSMPSIINALYTAVTDEDAKAKNIIGTISPNTRFMVDLIDFGKELADKFLEGDDISSVSTMNMFKDVVRRFPAGSQALRTAEYMLDRQRGYNQTPSGNVRFPIEQGNFLTTMKDLTFGSWASKYGREFNKAYDKLGESPYLTKTESEIFRSLNNAKDNSTAIDYWKSTVQGKLNKKSELTIKDILSGKSAEKMRQIEEARGSNYGVGLVNDVLMNDAIEDTLFSDFKRAENDLAELVRQGKETVETAEQKLKLYIESKGKTIDWYRARQYSSNDISVKNKAELIKGMMERGEMNLADWYKSGLLTSEVAKELYRMGVFNSVDEADAFYEKAKMTDVYYRDKEMQKLREESAKEWGKAASKAIRAMSKYRKSSMQKIISNTRNSRIKLTTKTKAYKPKVYKLSSKSRSIYNLPNSSVRATLSKIKAIARSKPSV